MRLQARFIAVIAFALLQRAALAAEAPEATATVAPRDHREFLWLHSVDGFNAIDDEHIMVSSGRRHALIKTFGLCLGLRDAETIAIDAPLTYLDKSGLGEIIYRQGPKISGRCPIDTIVSVDSIVQARDIVAKENAERSKTATPAK